MKKKMTKTFNRNFRKEAIIKLVATAVVLLLMTTLIIPQVIQVVIEPTTEALSDFIDTLPLILKVKPMAAPDPSWEVVSGVSQAVESELAHLYFWAVGIATVVITSSATSSLAKAYNRHHDGTYLGGKRASDNSGGSAYLTTRPRELKKITTGWSKNRKPKGSGIVVGNLGGTFRSIDYVNAILYGAPGSKKTRIVLIPTLCQHLAAGDSVVVLDPKGQVRDFTEQYAKSLGYKVVNIMLDTPQKSASWNPLERARQMEAGEMEDCSSDKAFAEIRSLAQIVVPNEKGGNPYFPDTARNLFSAIAYYVVESSDIKDEERNLTSVSEFISAVESDGTTGLDRIKRLAQSLPAGHASKQGLSTVASAPPEAANSVISTLANKLNDFVDGSVSKMLWRNGFNLSELSHQKTVVYVSFTSATGDYKRLVSALVSQLLASQRQEAQRQGGALERKVYFLLEEFAQLSRIERLVQDSGIMREEGLRLFFVLQNKPQLLTQYSKEEVEALLGNCDDILVLSVNDSESQKELAERIGYYSVKTHNNNKSKSYQGGVGAKSSSQSENEGSARRYLISPDEIGEWSWKSGLLLIRGSGKYAFPVRDLSDAFINKMLGLGDEKFNNKLRAERSKARTVVNVEPPPILNVNSKNSSESFQIASEEYDPLSNSSHAREMPKM